MREMRSLPQLSQPRGMRTVGAKPPRLRGQQEKCVLRGASLKKEQEGEASLRGGGSDTGFCWGQTMSLGGWSGRVSGDEKAGCKDRTGHVRGFVESQVQVLRGDLRGSDDIRGIKTLTEITLWGFSEVRQVKHKAWCWARRSGSVLFLLRKDFRASSCPPAQPSAHPPLNWRMRKRNVKI